MGFVQADPIRAPARAQDLTLRQRVKNYRAGDLARRYSALGLEEDYFVTYGFVTKSVHALMHPRPDTRISAAAQLLLEFVRGRDAVHPREVNDHFAHGTVKNYWGGSSNATTHLLDAMHYRGFLRVARREDGIRLFSARQHEPGPVDKAERSARIDALIDVIVRNYAPLPGTSLSILVRRLRYAVPQWQGELTAALQRVKQRLSQARIDGVDWYWPANAESAARRPQEDTVRLLAPFDPVVRDRRRFELLWGWVYRFEAYTPVSKRKLGYYAMPLLWGDRVMGWGNLSVKDGELTSEFGYVKSHPPPGRVFKRELDAELARMRAFLGLSSSLQAVGLQ